LAAIYAGALVIAGALVTAGALVAAGAGALAGCGGKVEPDKPWTDPDGGGDDGGGLDGSVGPSDGAADTDAITPVLQDKVYAHSASTLYEVDPNDLTVTVVGDFGWPAGSLGEEMTDIALDEDGNMVGVSFSRVYAVNKDSAECTYLSDLQSGMYNGLSWVEGVAVDPNVKTLVGVNTGGDYLSIDPGTGSSSQVGSYGGSYGSSGDLVYVRGAGIFATATHPSYGSDVLVSVHAPSGQATLIGETGFDSIWGLAYWGGLLFGFTDGGEFLTIDPDTGQGTLVESTGNSFWGAGVTTTAPIVQ
jgi:hypothetical protein